jgi:A/G-specific adenine glycosylase
VSRWRAGTLPDIATPLLAWYDANRRDLPWRYAPGVPADPYRVWLSEIMLQQTTVKAVIPYFEAFTRRWPTITDLAAAELDDVLAAWAGLGYYSRARNLHACAQAVVQQHAGQLPADETALRALPGIGPYTAAAVAAIGHGRKATPVDGNIERVMARLFQVEVPLPASKPILTDHARTVTPDQRAGDFAQALMDLGATICTPQSPSCLLCPIALPCRARTSGTAAELPRKLVKKPRPDRQGVAFVLVRGDGAILVRPRPPKGLLGGMLEVPTTEWAQDAPTPAAVRAAAPADVPWTTLNTPVVHVFTHFRLTLTVQVGRISNRKAPPGRWLAPDEIEGAALPSLMRHVIQAAISAPVKAAKNMSRRRAR